MQQAALLVQGGIHCALKLLDTPELRSRIAPAITLPSSNNSHRVCPKCFYLFLLDRKR
jgi:hypothetical protein